MHANQLVNHNVCDSRKISLCTDDAEIQKKNKKLYINIYFI